MSERAPNSTNQIENQKSFWSPNIFQYRTKHPQRKHVTENVHEASMHEHVRDELMWSKII